jgi:transcriptional regulator with XRE-family HTH domain
MVEVTKVSGERVVVSWRQTMGWDEAEAAAYFGCRQAVYAAWTPAPPPAVTRLMDATTPDSYAAAQAAAYNGPACRRARLSLGWTQSDLSEHLGTCRRAVGNVERDTGPAPLRFAVYLRHAITNAEGWRPPETIAESLQGYRDPTALELWRIQRQLRLTDAAWRRTFADPSTVCAALSPADRAELTMPILQRNACK